MPSEDDTDPTPKARPNATDPIFPPKLGVSAPVVSVTAIQGPGLHRRSNVREATTERLLTGLVTTPSDPSVKARPRDPRDVSGDEETAAYGTVRSGAAYRGENAAAVPGAPLSSSMNTTLDAPRDARRDDRTVVVPRGGEVRWRAAAAFFASLIVVWSAGWIFLRATTPHVSTATEATVPGPSEVPPPPVETAEPEIILPPASASVPMVPVESSAPSDEPLVRSEPVIESQPLKRLVAPRPVTPVIPARPRASASANRATPPSAASATSAASGGRASGALTSDGARTSEDPGGDVPPDFDELKKEITH
jgi:hypothetical protein